jgi:hypothetical protein
VEGIVPVVISAGMIDLLASYDLFLVSGEKTTFTLNDQKGGNIATGSKSAVFWRSEFLFFDVRICRDLFSERCS